MSPSPFHGIFSFNATQDTPFGAAQASTVPQQAHASTPADAESGIQVTSENEPNAQAKTGQIAVDIYEQDEYYIIRAPIAGVRLSDLDIEVDNKVITISGTRRMSESIPEDQYYLQECFWGDFSRSVTMPCAIDPKKVKATFSKDSILKIIIPKEEKVKIVRINESN